MEGGGEVGFLSLHNKTVLFVFSASMNRLMTRSYRR